MPFRGCLFIFEFTRKLVKKLKFGVYKYRAR